MRYMIFQSKKILSLSFHPSTIVQPIYLAMGTYLTSLKITLKTTSPSWWFLACLRWIYRTRGYGPNFSSSPRSKRRIQTTTRAGASFHWNHWIIDDPSTFYQNGLAKESVWNVCAVFLESFWQVPWYTFCGASTVLVTVWMVGIGWYVVNPLAMPGA